MQASMALWGNCAIAGCPGMFSSNQAANWDHGQVAESLHLQLGNPPTVGAIKSPPKYISEVWMGWPDQWHFSSSLCFRNITSQPGPGWIPADAETRTINPALQLALTLDENATITWASCPITVLWVEVVPFVGPAWLEIFLPASTYLIWVGLSHPVASVLWMATILLLQRSLRSSECWMQHLSQLMNSLMGWSEQHTRGSGIHIFKSDDA
jgi:hypothetical protein